MPADQPFAVVTASASGLGLAIVPGPLAGPSGVASLTSKNAMTLYIANTGPGPAWVRLTVETSVPAATQNDVCIPPNVVRLFGNPAPFGTCQIAVIATVTTTTQVYVTPGDDGVS